MPIESMQVRKGKAVRVSSPDAWKPSLLLQAAGIKPTTSWFGASLQIPVHHPRPSTTESVRVILVPVKDTVSKRCSLGLASSVTTDQALMGKLKTPQCNVSPPQEIIGGACGDLGQQEKRKSSTWWVGDGMGGWLGWIWDGWTMEWVEDGMGTWWEGWAMGRVGEGTGGLWDGWMMGWLGDGMGGWWMGIEWEGDGMDGRWDGWTMGWLGDRMGGWWMGMEWEGEGMDGRWNRWVMGWWGGAEKPWLPIVSGHLILPPRAPTSFPGPFQVWWRGGKRPLGWYQLGSFGCDANYHPWTPHQSFHATDSGSLWERWTSSILCHPNSPFININFLNSFIPSYHSVGLVWWFWLLGQLG